MSIARNTSAGRLYGIMEIAQSGNLKKDHTFQMVWANVFGIRESDTAWLLRVHGKVLGLPNSILRDTEECFGDTSRIHKAALQPWTEKLQGLSLGSKWESFQSFLDSGSNLATLATLAHVFEMKIKEAVLTGDQLIELMSELRDLMVRVRASDLPPVLRMAIVTYLWNLQEAILDYEVTGSPGVLEVCYSLAGIIATAPEAQDASNYATVAEVLKFTGTILTLTKFAYQGSELAIQWAEKIFPALGGPGA